MKKYNSPELKVMTFSPEEEIAAIMPRSAKSSDTGSNHFNDVEFGGW